MREWLDRLPNRPQSFECRLLLTSGHPWVLRGV